MDLLTNAIESLGVGVADYRTATRPRLLSAIRNIHAGILLLYKEALVRRSPVDSNEALVKAKVRPVERFDGAVEFIGIGKKTADVRTIRERFDSLGISTDWDRFGRISEIRNDVEHYYQQVSQESLKEVIASAFYIIRAFIADELRGDPAALLGKETWETMLEITEVFDAERKACDEGLGRFDWESDTLREGVGAVRCSSCGSSLLRLRNDATSLDDAVLKCVVCGAEKDSDQFVPEAVAEALDLEMYLVYDDGAEEPYVECPDCGLEAYVVEEQRCARCGTEYDGSCARCGNGIPPSELAFSPLCSYCSHIMSKDD